MVWIMVSWFCLVSVTLGVTMRHSLCSLQNNINEILSSLVQTLAESPSVRDVLETGRCSGKIGDFLGDIVRNSADLDYITIADTNSIRLYHIDPELIGKPFAGGDQHRALAGERYLSDANTEYFPQQRRAFHPVFDEKGTVLGFVMASATRDRITALRRDIYSAYFGLILLLTVCTLIFSGLLAVYLGRSLRGVKPENLLRVYLTQNDILNTLDEGLISIDHTGRVQLVNGAAARMLGCREDLLVGRNVDELLLAEDSSSLRSRTGRGLQSNRPNILVQPVQLPDSKLWARQVLILADKYEVMRYAEDPGGTRHMLSALRANTHEFLNKLQVISGLLQMGYVTEAQTYIGSLSAVHEHILGPVMKLIRNSNVAALILGKEGNLRELDIDLTLLSNSSLPEHSRYLATQELVTVVGNLLEHAMEAVDAAPVGQVRSVVL